MKNSFRLGLTVLFVLVCLLSLPSCASRGAVRHFASDVSLVVPQQTTVKEALTLLGYPNVKKTIGEGREEWIYYQANPSLLRRMAWMGERMGFTDYDMIYITIDQGIVVAHQYRMYTEAEFKKLGILDGQQ